MDNVRPVVAFNSVEEFWGCVTFPSHRLSSTVCDRTRTDGWSSCFFERLSSLYNNIVPPSQLPPKANYYLFKVRSFLPLPSRGAHC